MLKKLYDLLSIVRFFEFLFVVTKKISSPLESLIIPFIDWRLKPERPYEPGRGSALQLVIRPDERAYVGWPVLRYILRPFIGGRQVDEEAQGTTETSEEPSVSCGQMILRLPLLILVLALTAAMMVLLVPDFRDFLFPGKLPGFSLGNFSLPALPSLEVSSSLILGLLLLVLIFIALFLLWLAGLVLTYWRYEWQRRNTVFAFFTEGLLHLEAEFIGRAVSPFYIGEDIKVDTFTPADEMLEIELVTDVEDLIGGEKTSAWQDRWSQYLSKKYQIRNIRIASRSGADDILRAVAYAPTTMSCINKIIDQGVLYKKTYESFQQKEQEAKSANADSLNFDASAGARKVERVWDNFDRLYVQDAKRYLDAFAMSDPGSWNRRTGELRQVQSHSSDNPKNSQPVAVAPKSPEPDLSSSFFPPLNDETSPKDEVQTPQEEEKEEKQPPLSEPPEDKSPDNPPNDEETDSFWGALSS